MVKLWGPLELGVYLSEPLEYISARAPTLCQGFGLLLQCLQFHLKYSLNI